MLLKISRNVPGLAALLPAKQKITKKFVKPAITAAASKTDFNLGIQSIREKLLNEEKGYKQDYNAQLSRSNMDEKFSISFRTQNR